MSVEPGCLAAAEIVAYLDGALSEVRKAQIDRHLDECRLCGTAVEGVAGLEWREGFLQSTESVLARVRARTSRVVLAASAAERRARRVPAAPHYLALAATLVLGVGTAILLARPGPGESLFQRTFEPYPSRWPIVRGGPTNGTTPAQSSYEAGNYRGALAAFEERLRREPNDTEARFYAGVCRLALRQTREAILDLELVSRLGADDLRAPADWYLALAHVRGGHPFDARPPLERLAGAGGFYQEKARALLSELERLEKRDRARSE